MKKIPCLTAGLLVSLLSTIVVSCNKEREDTPDISDNPSIIVSFNTGSLYEELGIKEDMAVRLSASGDFSVIDSLLVYDRNGALVTKLGVESNSFEGKELLLEDIPEGTYTLILWQAAYRKTDGVQAWKVDGENSLSTVQLTSDGLSFGFAWAVGTASATVTCGKQSSKVELTPKAIGSIVDVTVDNIPEDAGYIHVSMIGGKYLKGLYLDPSRGEDRWIGDNFSGVVFRLYPEDEGKRKFFTLIHGEDLGLFIRGDKEGSFDDFSSCPHKTVATGEYYTFYFDVARSDWQPPYFGPSGDFAAWKADRDAGLLVFDPCLEWGSNLSHVEEYVQSKNWWDYDNSELFRNSGYWCKAYWVADYLKEAYYFETQDGQNLRLVICFCDDTSVPVEVALNLLKLKGFDYVGEVYYVVNSKAYSYFVTADKTLQATLNTDMFANWAIAFEPYLEEDNECVLSAVDLGLSVQWGTRNLGAQRPEEVGDYFAWGEVEPHYSSLNPLTWKEGMEDGYDWTTYSMCDGTLHGFTKYFHPDYDGQGWCFWAGEGEPDKKMALDPEDDAAHVMLGGSWRIPSVGEIEELVATKKDENYKWEYGNLNGHEGMFVTYLVNGNQIFLPYTGMWDGTTHSSTNEELDDMYREGLYWGSTMPKVAPYYGYCLHVGETSVASRTVAFRNEGLAIRPVKE